MSIPGSLVEAQRRKTRLRVDCAALSRFRYSRKLFNFGKDAFTEFTRERAIKNKKNKKNDSEEEDS